MRALLVALALTACKPAPTTDEAPATSCTKGARQTGLISALRFARPDDEGRIDGFDLDAAESSFGGATGCGKADDLSPDGVVGVDASFNHLLPALELTEGAALEQIIQQLINEGEVLILWDLHGIDDPQQDSCVTLDVLHGAGSPIVGGKGLINPGQSFDVDTTEAQVRVENVALESGTFAANGFAFELPFSFLDANITVALQNLAMRVTVHEDGSFTGLMGGGLVIEDLLAQLEPTGIAREVKTLIASAMASGADLAPDEFGDCKQMSASIEFEGVSAFLFDDPPVDTASDSDAE